MREEAESIPTILYHYTSIESFKKMLESRTIRATRYDQMNDWSEVQLGVKLLLRAIKARKVDDSIQQYKDFLISGVEGYTEEPLEVYVLSLSAAADSLGQWRAYAARGGVAIGFDMQVVRNGFLRDITGSIGGVQVSDPVRPDPGNRLMRCEYTDKNGNLDLTAIVERRFFKSDSFPAFRSSGQSLGNKSFWPPLSVMIYRTICSIKHGAYKYEQEWRCINIRPRPEDYPVKLSENNRLYIEMQFAPEEFIKEVWISPHGDADGYERAVAHLRQENGLSFRIKRSTIPFRG